MVPRRLGIRVAAGRNTMKVPGNVTTLAAIPPGHSVTLRAVLYGAGATVAALRTGDVLHCRHVTADELILELNGRSAFTVARDDAAHVQVERVIPGSGWRRG